MLRVLIESGRQPFVFLPGALASTLAHAAVIGGVIAAGAVSGGGAAPPPRLQSTIFLIPPDRFPARKPQIVNLRWTAAPPDVGSGPYHTEGPQGMGFRPSSNGIARSGRASEFRPAWQPDSGESRLDSVYTKLLVDSIATRYPESAAPAYPPDLLASGVEGTVYTQFIVDTNGTIDTASVRVLTSSDPGFEASVRAALPAMRFYPAVLGGRRVRQLVEQHFHFAITPTVQLN